MSKRPPTRRRALQGTARLAGLPAGFTLIELMIAMLLGLIVIAGVTSVFLATQRSYRTNVALGDVQDGSRIAFELMARDIRDAGLTGCGTGDRVANVLNNSTTDWWADWGNAVHGYGSGTAADPALAGLTTGVQVAGTDSLQLLGAVDTGLSVYDTPSGNAANFKINDKTFDLKIGDVVIVCDPDHAAIVQITGYNASNVTFGHNAGNANPSPGNCSKGLGYPTTCTTNGTPYLFGSNSQMFKLGAVDWYIGTNPVGGTSLYRVSVATASAGATPTGTTQEMVRNVTAMNIRYHQSNPLGTSFVDANAIGAGNWASVDAVQVQLTLESVDKYAGTDVKAISRSFTATTTVLNRVK